MGPYPSNGPANETDPGSTAWTGVPSAALIPMPFHRKSRPDLSESANTLKPDQCPVRSTIEAFAGLNVNNLPAFDPDRLDDDISTDNSDDNLAARLPAHFQQHRPGPPAFPTSFPRPKEGSSTAWVYQSFNTDPVSTCCQGLAVPSDDKKKKKKKLKRKTKAARHADPVVRSDTPTINLHALAAAPIEPAALRASPFSCDRSPLPSRQTVRIRPKSKSRPSSALVWPTNWRFLAILLVLPITYATNVDKPPWSEIRRRLPPTSHHLYNNSMTSADKPRQLSYFHNRDAITKVIDDLEARFDTTRTTTAYIKRYFIPKRGKRVIVNPTYASFMLQLDVQGLRDHITRMRSLAEAHKEACSSRPVPLSKHYTLTYRNHSFKEAFQLCADMGAQVPTANPWESIYNPDDSSRLHEQFNAVVSTFPDMMAPYRLRQNFPYKIDFHDDKNGVYQTKIYSLPPWMNLTNTRIQDLYDIWGQYKYSPQHGAPQVFFTGNFSENTRTEHLICYHERGTVSPPYILFGPVRASALINDTLSRCLEQSDRQMAMVERYERRLDQLEPNVDFTQLPDPSTPGEKLLLRNSPRQPNVTLRRFNDTESSLPWLQQYVSHIHGENPLNIPYDPDGPDPPEPGKSKSFHRNRKRRSSYLPRTPVFRRKRSIIAAIIFFSILTAVAVGGSAMGGVAIYQNVKQDGKIAILKVRSARMEDHVNNIANFTRLAAESINDLEADLNKTLHDQRIAFETTAYNAFITALNNDFALTSIAVSDTFHQFESIYSEALSNRPSQHLFTKEIMSDIDNAVRELGVNLVTDPRAVKATLVLDKKATYVALSFPVTDDNKVGNLYTIDALHVGDYRVELPPRFSRYSVTTGHGEYSTALSPEEYAECVKDNSICFASREAVHKEIDTCGAAAIIEDPGKCASSHNKSFPYMDATLPIMHLAGDYVYFAANERHGFHYMCLKG